MIKVICISELAGERNNFRYFHLFVRFGGAGKEKAVDLKAHLH